MEIEVETILRPKVYYNTETKKYICEATIVEDHDEIEKNFKEE